MQVDAQDVLTLPCATRTIGTPNRGGHALPAALQVTVEIVPRFLVVVFTAVYRPELVSPMARPISSAHSNASPDIRSPTPSGYFYSGSTDRARLESEMLGSKSDLESRLGKPVHFFAFPFGEQRNMSSVAIEVATAAYPYFASSFGGENLPHTTLSHRHLLRKNLYPDLLEL